MTITKSILAAILLIFFSASAASTRPTDASEVERPAISLLKNQLAKKTNKPASVEAPQKAEFTTEHKRQIVDRLSTRGWYEIRICEVCPTKKAAPNALSCKQMPLSTWVRVDAWSRKSMELAHAVHIFCIYDGQLFHIDTMSTFHWNELCRKNHAVKMFFKKKETL